MTLRPPSLLRRPIAAVAAVSALVLAGWTHAPAQEGSDPALARRLFDLAEQLAAEGKSDQALQRYEEVQAADPRGPLAAEALVAIARIHYPVLDLADLGRGSVEGLERALPPLRRVREEYPRSDVAPEALFRLALIALDPLNPARDPDEAWADFAAVVSVYPDSPLAARALRASALLDEQLGRNDSALLSWFRLAEEYPASGLLARARLGLGRMLVATGRADLALGELQAAREAAGDDTVAAAEALDLLGLAARVGSIGVADPGAAYRDDGSLGANLELKNPSDLAIGASGEVAIADRGGNRVVTLRPDGRSGGTTTVERPDAITFGPQGDLWIAGGGRITGPYGSAPLEREEGRRFAVRSLAPAGPWGVYAIDADRREVLRLGRSGRFRGVVSLPEQTVPVDLAAAPGGGVLVLDGKGGRVIELDADGAVQRVVGPTGPGWELRRPEHVDRDLAGNVFVLDVRTREVVVIRPDGSLLARVVSPREGDGAFQRPAAMAVDRAGRILILDERDGRVVRYR